MEFAKGALEKALHCSIYIYIYYHDQPLVDQREYKQMCSFCTGRPKPPEEEAQQNEQVCKKMIFFL